LPSLRTEIAAIRVCIGHLSKPRKNLVVIIKLRSRSANTTNALPCGLTTASTTLPCTAVALRSIIIQCQQSFTEGVGTHALLVITILLLALPVVLDFVFGLPFSRGFWAADNSYGKAYKSGRFTSLKQAMLG
jgi:hypothetical protein